MGPQENAGEGGTLSARLMEVPASVRPEKGRKWHPPALPILKTVSTNLYRSRTCLKISQYMTFTYDQVLFK